MIIFLQVLFDAMFHRNGRFPLGPVMNVNFD